MRRFSNVSPSKSFFNTVLGDVNNVANDISDSATKIAVEKAWRIMELNQNKRRSFDKEIKNPSTTEITVSVSVGPINITLFSPPGADPNFRKD